jgi:hypothetical protein
MINVRKDTPSNPAQTTGNFPSLIARQCNFAQQKWRAIMPAISTITVNDDSAVAQAYEPISASPALSMWKDKVGPVTLNGQPKLTASLTPAGQTGKYEKVKIVFSYPQEDTVDTVTTVSNVAFATLETKIPRDFETANRQDFATLLINLLSDSMIKNYIYSGDPAY